MLKKRYNGCILWINFSKLHKIRSFEGYLGVRGLQLESLLLEADIGAVVMQAGKYLRVSRHGELSAYHGNTFIATLRRLLLLLPAHRRACDRSFQGALVEVEGPSI